uniref:Aspartyl-phosphate phosphatase Spo0E family protein n=1 Tax=Anaerobacillus isosaccharinicus TaxID=1532552 RepID=A0A1S2MFI0_9BACI
MPSNLTNQIEHKRKEMSEIIEKHGLSSTKAIRCSHSIMMCQHIDAWYSSQKETLNIQEIIFSKSA